MSNIKTVNLSDAVIEELNENETYQKILRTVQQYGADSELDDQMLSLHAAIIYDLSHLFDALLDADVSLNCVCVKTGKTALHLSYDDQGKYFAKLLQRGADPNILGSNEQTVLQEAAEHGHLDNNGKPTKNLQLLLSNERTERDKKGRNGNTALHFAMINKHAAYTEILILAGVDINARNDQGRTALEEVQHRQRFADRPREFEKVIIVFGYALEQRQSLAQVGTPQPPPALEPGEF